MAKPFKVTIVTPEKTAYEAEAVSVILPGTEGYLGVWANHAPLVTGLRQVILPEWLAAAGGVADTRGGWIHHQ